MSETSDLPLFVFGTLMDPDVFEVVTERRLASFPTRAASLPGMTRRAAAGEHYPVLVSDAAGAVEGLLIERLYGEPLARARFFEGEEFELERVTVEIATESRRLDACYFADRTCHEHGDRAWRLSDWQRHAKHALMPRIRRYMACYGRMSVAEADAYW